LSCFANYTTCPALLSPRQPKIGDPVGHPQATKASEAAVLAALRWLRDHQESNGSWKCPRSSSATTGLALLAFFAHGETDDSTEFGDAVNRGLRFLIQSIDATGTVSDKSMYAQAIVTLALCEGYALIRSPVLREPAERAAHVLLTAQAVPKSNPLHSGGWRYTSTSADADTSVTGWSIMALQAADHAGIAVTPETFTKASAYLWRMHGQDGFGYAAPGDAPVPTAIATFCLQFLGHAGDTRLHGALDLLKKQNVSWPQSTGAFVLYGWYYTTLAMFQGGGAYWENWHQKIAPALMAAQADDGSWPPPPHSSGEAAFAGTPTYATALGAMILETYYRYQPQYLQKKKAG
ncbi:MAG: prenyltransferase/squalene oxidase repeat-containing protein, partial [Verrucomicrobiota bacterium]